MPDISSTPDRELLIQVLTTLQTMEEELVEIKHTLHGNGQPGVKDRLAKLEESASTTRKILFGLIMGLISVVPGAEFLGKIFSTP